MLSSLMEEIIVIVRVEAGHGVEEYTYEVLDRQRGGVPIKYDIENKHDTNMAVVKTDSHQNIKMSSIGEVNEASKDQSPTNGVESCIE